MDRTLDNCIYLNCTLTFDPQGPGGSASPVMHVIILFVSGIFLLAGAVNRTLSTVHGAGRLFLVQ